MDGMGTWAALALALGIFWGARFVYAAGRIRGMREGTESLSRSCSFHYERSDEPMPEKVDAALTSLQRALKQSHKDRLNFYLNAAAALGDAMGYAAWSPGYDAGIDAQEPRDGDSRIDMPIERWRIIRWLADIPNTACRTIGQCL